MDPVDANKIAASLEGYAREWGIRVDRLWDEYLPEQQLAVNQNQKDGQP